MSEEQGEQGAGDRERRSGGRERRSGDRERRAADRSGRESDPLADRSDRSSRPSIEDLLEYLARGLVDRPEEVSVERFDEGDGTTVLELSVGEQDYGKVIGRGGRTAQALRTVVRAAAAGQTRRVLIDIVD